jgi:hypothetical protein
MAITVAVLLPFVPQVILRAQSNDLSKAPLEKRTTKVFNDTAIQMELPDVASVSSSKKGVLIMLHPTTEGEQAEQGYCVKINVTRLSKEETESNSRMATHPLTDEFNKWYTTNHPSLDLRKAPKTWRMRKDVPTPGGLSLFVDCQIAVTKSLDADLLETRRIVESVKPLR